MKPTSFPQANRTLMKPAGMTAEECGDLPSYTDGAHVISRWRLTWPERLSILLTGKLWLWVWSGHTQPPVALTTESPFTGRGWMSYLRKTMKWGSAIALALLSFWPALPAMAHEAPVACPKDQCIPRLQLGAGAMAVWGGGVRPDLIPTGRVTVNLPFGAAWRSCDLMCSPQRVAVARLHLLVDVQAQPGQTFSFSPDTFTAVETTVGLSREFDDAPEWAVYAELGFSTRVSADRALYRTARWACAGPRFETGDGALQLGACADQRPDGRFGFAGVVSGSVHLAGPARLVGRAVLAASRAAPDTVSLGVLLSH